MKSILLFGLTTFLLGRCQERPIPASERMPDAFIIRTGTSFGMCVGYCQNDYVFNGINVTLTQNGTRSRGEQAPKKTCESMITPAEWKALKALANLEAFAKQPATLGCPDCADGGAEYVELQAGDRTHRVTFEPNKPIPGFEPLIDLLRKKRENFKECK